MSLYDYFAQRHRPQWPRTVWDYFGFDAGCDFYDHEFCYRLVPLGEPSNYLIAQGYIQRWEMAHQQLVSFQFFHIQSQELFKRAYRYMKERGDRRLTPSFVTHPTGSEHEAREREAAWLEARSSAIDDWSLYCKPIGAMSGNWPVQTPLVDNSEAEAALSTIRRDRVKAVTGLTAAANEILTPVQQQLLSKVRGQAEKILAPLAALSPITPLAPPVAPQNTLTLCCAWAGGEGLGNLPFRATLADGSVRTGRLDAAGAQTLTGLPPGAVEVEFGEAVADAELQRLRHQLKTGLDDILRAEQKEAAELDATYRNRSGTGKTWSHAGALGKGLWNGLVGFVTWVNDVSKLASPAGHLSRSLQATWAASRGESDEAWLKRFQDAYSEEHKKDLVAALGFDPSQISRDDLAQAYAIANLLLDDEATRRLFHDFAKQVATAQHALEWSETAGGLAFELILTALLAVATGGIGAAATTGAKIRHADKLKVLAGPLKELAEKLKQKRLHRRKSGQTGSRLEAKVKRPTATPLQYRTNGDYEPHPEVKAPKAGDRIFKRQHSDGNPEDPYTLQADGKPMGADVGAMPKDVAGMEALPTDHDLLVKEDWPTLNYDNKATYATFTEVKPVILPPGMKLYRLVDEKNPDAGGFWARSLPKNKTEWRRDYAVKDSWNDDGYYVERTVGPEGLKAWEGPAAGQRYRKHEGNDFYLSGGKEQIFITPGSIVTSPPKLTHWPEP